MNDRILELSTLISDGNPDELIRLLRAQGKTVERQHPDGDAYTVRWEDGSFTTAFVANVGLADAVQTVFLCLFGPLGCALPMYGEVQKAAAKLFKKRKEQGT